MRKAVPVVALVVIALIIIEIVANASKRSSTAQSTSTAPSSRAPAAAPPASTTETTTRTTGATTVTHTRPTGQPATSTGIPKAGRCGDITVNQHTSCAFAQVVVKEYDSRPAATFLAHSPVTGLTYTMRCERSRGIVACSDNGTSTLTFNGPP